MVVCVAGRGVAHLHPGGTPWTLSSPAGQHALMAVAWLEYRSQSICPVTLPPQQGPFLSYQYKTLKCYMKMASPCCPKAHFLDC